MVVQAVVQDRPAVNGEDEPLFVAGSRTTESLERLLTGPPFVKLGHLPEICARRLEAFVQDAARRSTSDAATPRARRKWIPTEPLLERMGRAPLTPTADAGYPPPPNMRLSNAWPTSDVDTPTASAERPKK